MKNAPIHHVYLIPGFFGFANLGRLRYFVHLNKTVGDLLAKRGVPHRLHVVRTHPTASLPRRAARLAEVMAATLTPGGFGHLIGHSTGGLDARLFLTEGVSLPTRAPVETLAARVKSVVSVSTPHYGTPLAAFFTTRGGQQLLAVLSLGTSYVLRFGHLPLSALAQIASLIGAAPLGRLQATLFDDLAESLLADFSTTRRRAVVRLLREVNEDQSLLLQLTPEAMDLFNAAVSDRRTVRYGCVVTRARPPGVRSTFATGFDPAAQAAHVIYQGLYRLSSAAKSANFRGPSALRLSAMERALGRTPSPTANDGIVPTRSQVWGRILVAVRADHLDVIGHFNQPDSTPPHYDWLTTASGFDELQFVKAWRRVVQFLVP